jgi:imidazolonepropionase-like amidohydrolase
VLLPRAFERAFARPGATPSGAASPSPLAIVKAARDAGVRLVPGTGLGLPGFGLIRELQLFVAAGMTPAEALRAATTEAAGLLRMGDSGSVEVGKRADFVLSTASPLDDIANLGTTKWVVSNGNVYDAAALWAAVGLGR